MKKYMMALCLLLCGVLAACSREEPELVGVRFERGHGSVWGNQFYIDVCAREIVVARYFPEGASEQTVCEHTSISPEQWDEICAAVRGLELKQDRPSLWQSLWGNRKLDGGEYRKLTLVWETGKGQEEITYQWPSGRRADVLEILLEQLAAAGT